MLNGTVRAISDLEALKDKLAQGDRTALNSVLQATDVPMLDAQRRDEYLFILRNEVSELHMKVDSLSTGTRAVLPFLGDPFHTEPPTTPFQSASTGAQTAGPKAIVATTGLSDEQKRALSLRQLPVGPLSSTVSGVPETVRAFEEEGFSADVMRQSRLYFRAGRYAEALTLLEGLKSEPEAMYWMARCFEKLEREAEAVTMYRAVIDAEDSNPFQTRAQHDVEFLEWKRSFFKKDGQ